MNVVSKFNKSINYLLFFLILCIVDSCSYVIPKKSSQLYYQKKTRYLGDYKVIKFNDSTLKKLILNSNKSNFVIVHCNKFCRPVINSFYTNKACFDNESTYFIPIIHNYLYNIRNMTEDTSCYNIEKELYVTDVKIYGKGLNPNMNYINQFIAKYYPMVWENQEYKIAYFKFENKRVYFLNFNDYTSIEDLKKNSIEVQYPL